MTTDAKELPAFGSPEFWEFYDNFCSLTSLTKLVNEQGYELALHMHSIMHAAHLTRAIHKLSRPDREWNHHKAWLTLMNAPIQRDDGENGMWVRAGDVMIVEHGWDRDVFITHAPIERNMVSGYMLSGKWPPMIGLFMPLFDKATIVKCVELRTSKNVTEALELAEQESKDWRWY